MSNFIRFNSNPITDYLTDNWEKIKDEFVSQRKAKMGHNLLQVQTVSNKLNAVTAHEKKPLYQGNIIAAAIYVKKEILSEPEATQLKWQPTEEERWWRDNVNDMPTLSRWIETYKEYIAGVIFYAAQPGARINHHYGVNSTYNNLRLHLCLTADPDCVFDIENERWSWVEGDIFGFDDASYFHGIKHNGTKPRIVLVIDIKKDLLKPYAKNWPDREFIPRLERTPPKILNW
jgi:hypothetical protein